MRKTALLLLTLLMISLWAGCVSADTLILPEDTVTVGEEAFAGDARVDGVVFPEGLREIGARAFAGCGLDFVFLPDSLERLGEDAFDGGVAVCVAPDSPAADVLDAMGVPYTVLDLPARIAPAEARAEVGVGKQVKLSVICEPADADLPPLRWSSSDTAVASVSSDGTVTGIAEGTATVRAESFRGLAAEFEVTVYEPVYRALLVANVHYGYEIARWNDGDITLLTRMFSSVNAPNGRPWEVTVMYDLTEITLESAIRDTFADTREGDVSLFHISSHGETRSPGEYAGRLKMPHPDGSLTYVQYNILRRWMDKYVKGEMVMFLESCSSGSAIDSRAGAPFCGDRFYVLTSSRWHEACFSNDGKYNYFVQWLTGGIGTSGTMRADTDRDHKVTLGELYAYISKVGDNYKIGTYPEIYYQHVCVYPENSDFVLFVR